MAKTAPYNTDLARILAIMKFGYRAMALVTAALAFSTIAAAEHDRNALWNVVKICRAMQQKAGVALPCLKVDLSGGVDRGYVILRPPLGDEDFILSPTRAISGVEDPSIAAAAAPNYFEDAWNARAVLDAGGRRAVARENAALAVNSRLARSQDQLHIHIGCLRGDARSVLAANESELDFTQWRRLAQPIHGVNYWGLRIAETALASTNPFRLIAQGPSEISKHIGNVSIVLARSQSGAADGGFVLLATSNDPSRSAKIYGGADILRPSCG